MILTTRREPARGTDGAHRRVSSHRLGSAGERLRGPAGGDVIPPEKLIEEGPG